MSQINANAKTLNAAALAAAVAGAVAMVTMAAPSQAADMMGGSTKGKERCYGVTRAGENACASANGSHSCTAQAKVDKSGADWKLVEAGTCVEMGGQLKAFDNTKEMSKIPDKKGG